VTAEPASHRDLSHGEAAIQEECSGSIKPVRLQQTTERQSELFLYHVTGTVRAQVKVAGYIL